MENDEISIVVLDSNVLISLLVFADPRYPLIARGWRENRLRVVTDEDCTEEFRRVLAYPQLRLDETRQLAVFAEFRRLSSRHEGPPAAEQAMRNGLPLCADADDQKFLELAARSSADFLVTGDRELLKLARHVTFAIVTADELERRLGAQPLG